MIQKDRKRNTILFFDAFQSQWFILAPEHALITTESFPTLNISEHYYLQKFISKLKVTRRAGTCLARGEIA